MLNPDGDDPNKDRDKKNNKRKRDDSHSPKAGKGMGPPEKKK